MKYNFQIVFFMLISLSTILCQKKDGSYEFGFNIDGEQHRHEKRDQNGIVQGEFGFITADGIYHVTVYATDENGKFKILSMKNIRISAPLDGSPLRGEISPEAEKYRKKAGLPPLPPPPVPAPAPLAPPQNPPIDSVIADTNPKPVAAVDKPTGIIGCANCLVYTPAPPTPPPPPQQQPIPVDLFNPNQNSDNNYYQQQQPSLPASAGPVYQGTKLPQQTNYPAISANPSYNAGDAGFSGNDPNLNNNGLNSNFGGVQPSAFVDSGHNPLDSQNPSLTGSVDNSGFGIPDSTGGASDYPQGPQSPLSQSTLPPISVADNSIYVGGDNPQVIPIKDKFSGMQPGLPNGIEEKDVTGLLYKFHYTVGFHGHYEKGLKNGAKIGGYFVNGRDGISRVVTYTADENGYRAKVKYVNLGLDSDDTPKPETEKTFGLKSFEFIWYPLN